MALQQNTLQQTKPPSPKPAFLASKRPALQERFADDRRMKLAGDQTPREGPLRNHSAGSSKTLRAER